MDGAQHKQYAYKNLNINYVKVIDWFRLVSRQFKLLTIVSIHMLFFKILLACDKFKLRIYCKLCCM